MFLTKAASVEGMKAHIVCAVEGIPPYNILQYL
jgi:hypothetical protein